MNLFLRYELEEICRIDEFNRHIWDISDEQKKHVVECFFNSLKRDDCLWNGNVLSIPASDFREWFMTDNSLIVLESLDYLCKKLCLPYDGGEFPVICKFSHDEAAGAEIHINEGITEFLVKNGYRSHDGYRDYFITRSCSEKIDPATGKRHWETVIHTPVSISRSIDDVRNEIKEYIEARTAEGTYQYELIMDLDENVWDFKVHTEELIIF